MAIEGVGPLYDANINTLGILHEARETVANAFREEYKHVTLKRTEEAAKGWGGYHLTGIDIGNKRGRPEIEIRMQIKESSDEKRKLHFARYIPKEHLDATLMGTEFIDDDEARIGYKNFSVQGRHPHLMMTGNDRKKHFIVPTDGIGIYTTFEDPSHVAGKLAGLDTFLTECIENPITDPLIMGLLEKLGPEEFYNHNR